MPKDVARRVASDVDDDGWREPLATPCRDRDAALAQASGGIRLLPLHAGMNA